MIIIFSYRTVARIINEYIQNIIWYFGTKNINVKFHAWSNRQEVEDYVRDNNISNCVVIYVKDYVIKFPESLNIQEIILNTEQLLTLSYRQPSINFVLDANCPVIDYSEINMDIIKKNSPETKCYHFPYIYNPTEPIYSIPWIPDCDVAVIGAYSDYRYKIIQDMEKSGIRVNYIQSYGLDRDKYICKCKIVLNLHYISESDILETIRCYPVIFKKIVVISEESQRDPNIKINELIIYEKYDKLVEKVLQVLSDYENYKNKLEQFNFVEENKLLLDKIDIFINEYNDLIYSN